MTFKFLNEWVAVHLTLVFGSMWCAYVFLAWAVVPILLPNAEPVVAYVSQAVIQLVALPLIMVGSNVLSRATEERAKQDHQALIALLSEMQETLDDSREELRCVREIHNVIVLQPKN